MTVELADLAWVDLSDIYRYVNRDDPRAAARLIDSLEEACRNLSKHPLIGTRRNDLKPGLRMLSHGSYIICFRQKEPNVVRVVRVLHGARDIQAGDFSA